MAEKLLKRLIVVEQLLKKELDFIMIMKNIFLIVEKNVQILLNVVREECQIY